MKAALCRLCGVRHWGTCMANAKAIAPTGVANGMANKENPTPRNVISKIAVTTPKTSSTYKYRDREKRRAYQRELMRKRRAKNG